MLFLFFSSIHYLKLIYKTRHRNIASYNILIKIDIITTTINQSRYSDCNWTRTQNHLVLKRTLNHLAKLAK